MVKSIIRSDKPVKAADESELVHMLYDAVADNSLWPEMISELMEHLESASEKRGPHGAEEFESLIQHFRRAMKLSESIVDLQERNSTLDGVLNSLSFGLCVYDHAGKQLYANNSARSSGIDDFRISPHLLNSARYAPGRDKELPMLKIVGGCEVAIVPVTSIENTRLPASAATLVISMPSLPGHTLDYLQKVYYLTDSETALLARLHENRNVRVAAEANNISYESARTYLKRIYAKTGSNNQASLMAMLDSNPVSLVDRLDLGTRNDDPVRRELLLPDGRNLEFFRLGPADGKAILHFDALTGVAIDLLGAADLYRPCLEALGLQIIVPCRPGTFKSHFRKMDGLSDMTPDILHLLDHLGVDTVTLISQAFGSCSALAFAATAPDRVAKTILCAPSYPRHEPPDWRQMDVFYIISGVIGRRAPSLLKAIIPFLMRSVMQNTAKYLERHITRSHCPADIQILSSPTLQRRIPEMLAARTALGTDGLVQENFLNTHGWDFDLNDIRSPVLILQGELDNVSHPAGSRKLAGALPNAVYHSFPDFGQYLLFTEWPWILEACAGDAAFEAIDDPLRAPAFHAAKNWAG